MSLVILTLCALCKLSRSLSASVALHADNEVQVYVSRDGGNEWTGPIAESYDWQVTLKFTVEDVTTATRFRFNCTDIHQHSVGGFIATVTFNGEEYSTTNPIESGNYALVYASDGVYAPLVYNNITDGVWHDVFPDLDLEVAADAYWIWNENVYNTLIFEFDFDKNNIIPTPAPTTCFNTIHDWIIDDIGQSSQFRFISPCSDSKQFMKVKMKSLIEYDATNGRQTKNKRTSFASTNWYWITEEDTQFEGFDATVNKYVSTFQMNNNAVEFNLTTILFYENGHLNGSAPFFENTLKWTTDVSNWPFLDEQNTLELCINVMTNAGGADKGNGDGNDTSRFTFSDFEFRLENSAKRIRADPPNEVIDLDVDIYTNQKNSNHLDLCFTFRGEMGDGIINYDPFIQFIGDNNDDNAEQSVSKVVEISVSIGVVIFVVLLVFVFVSFYHKKNKALQRNVSLIKSADENGGYDTIHA